MDRPDSAARIFLGDGGLLISDTSFSLTKGIFSCKETAEEITHERYSLCVCVYKHRSAVPVAWQGALKVAQGESHLQHKNSDIKISTAMDININQRNPYATSYLSFCHCQV